MRTEARRIALGGMMAALAVVLMAMGGMIPVATYVIPMLCMFLLRFVYGSCGRRIAWAWYGAVALLGLLWNFGLDGIWFNFAGVNIIAAILSLFLLTRIGREIKIREAAKSAATSNLTDI